MPKAIILLSFFCLTLTASHAQTYASSLQTFRNNYVNTHEVVKGSDRKFLRFFPIDRNFIATAHIEKIYDAPWMKMETSGKEKKQFRVYAYATFKIKDTSCKLAIYQAQDLLANPAFAKYLFLPFTDKTSGFESYENGRYIDLKIDDLDSDDLQIDFNKAYNPYCAYISNTYNCPIPPKENDLPVAIMAGEMKYGKSH
jgi:uncharacterized protein (DUF1684 family)